MQVHCAMTSKVLAKTTFHCKKDNNIVKKTNTFSVKKRITFSLDPCQ